MISITISWVLSCLIASERNRRKLVSKTTQAANAVRCLTWVVSFLFLISTFSHGSEQNSSGSVGTVLASEGKAELGPQKLGTNSYILSVNDLIKIEIYKEEDLKRETRVDQDGTVSLPLIQSVKLAGYSIAAARNLIKTLYEKDYLVSADVAITLLATGNTNAVVVTPKLKFQVTGEVKKPGMIEFPEGGERVDLVQAIGMAGDFTGVANKSSIKIRRSENGRERVFDEDVKKMLDGKSKQFLILPGDVITVRQTVF